MEGFISQIAQRLYEKHGDEISSLSVLFPSRRSRLFFADALAGVTDKPLWQPTYTSIDEIMESISGISSGDQVRLITELYKVYSQYHKEEFGSFYFWGEMLLADFDTVDKYRIDADMLFANISDLKTIEDDLSYLTPEQRAVIVQFWKNFSSAGEFSQEKERFFAIWKTLSPIYHSYKKRLTELGFAYTGMIHREATDRIKAGTAETEEQKKFVIAGFNALTECEKILFNHLSKSHNVDFFWDYDQYYLKDQDQEAGLFMRYNVEKFPQTEELPYNNEGFTEEKEIVVVSTPSNSLQSKYVYDFIEEVATSGSTPGKETAVVLTDENMLMPVLYSIPDSVETVNITMGYPLRQTLVYSFVERLIELQKRCKVRSGRTVFYHSDVSGLLWHPFIRETLSAQAENLTDEIIRRRQIYVESIKLESTGVIDGVFTKTESWQELSDYLISILSEVARMPYEGADRQQRIEFLSVTVDNIRKLVNSLVDCGVDITQTAFISLLRNYLQAVRVPYEGEPLQGVQIMGILETRSLDFENVVVLSVNDDTFPGNRAVSPSFIPYNLRLAYGLPTPAHHEGVYAYYFYRLLQRAKKVHLVYCSKSDEKSTGEPSRYIHQLRYESHHKIVERQMTVDVNLEPIEPISIEKNDEVMEAMAEFFEGGQMKLSPTAFYTYVECPLKFYFRSVARLKIEDELTEEVDASDFGNILHKAMEILYKDLLKLAEPADKVKELIGSVKVGSAVSKAIEEAYFRRENVPEDEYGGNLVLVKDIVCKYINNCLLPYDARQSGFTIIELEKRVGCGFGFEANGVRKVLNFGGLADRVDSLSDGRIRVVDYKTGKMNLDFKGVEALFSESEKERSSAALQTLLYAMMINKSMGREVVPALYYVRNINSEDYSPLLEDKESGSCVERYSDYQADFEDKLRDVLADMYNTSKPFMQCAENIPCKYCDFNEICRR